MLDITCGSQLKYTVFFIIDTNLKDVCSFYDWQMFFKKKKLKQNIIAKMQFAGQQATVLLISY